MNWQTITSIHFVGIKGVAMTSFAVWAKQKGCVVTGADTEETFPTDAVLSAAGIVPSVGFEPSGLPKCDVVVYTGAHQGRENPQVIAAQEKGIPSFPHGQALGEIMREKKQISIAGCHGKTTTTAMVSTILIHAGLDPSYVIGSGVVGGLGLSGHYGKGEYFVAEADEYVTDPGHDMTPRLLWQNPTILAITTIDFDHPDVYRDLAHIGSVYQQAADKVPENGNVIWNASDDNSFTFLNGRYREQEKTFGFFGSDIVVKQLEQRPFENACQFTLADETVNVTLKVSGKHNALNAAAAFLIGKQVGLKTEIIVQGLEMFKGAARRFEHIGTVNSAPVIDDYAHHPNEIVSTIKAAREWYPSRRIVTIFQPHTYSRTKTLLNEFAESLQLSDIVILTDIYASARETIGEVTSLNLADTIRLHSESVYYMPAYEDIKQWLSTQGQENDVILFMGAGNIGQWAQKFVTENI